MNDIEEIIKYSQKLKLLYVEDNQEAREATISIFEEFFSEIIVSVDGQDGYEKFNDNQDTIDIIITDINMPKLNGIEMIQKIKKINEDIPILILSAYNNSEFFIDSIQLGVEGYILKPIDINQFMIVLKKVTKKIQIKKNLIYSQQLLNQYKDAVDESAIVSKTNIKGIITYVNKEFCNISGYTEDELMGKNHNIVRHPDMPSSAFKDLWHTIKELKQTWKGTVQNKKKDGSSYWVKAIIKPIIDINGEIIEYIGIRTDITEQEQVKKYFEHKLNSSIDDLDGAMKLSKEYEMAINESNIVSRTDLDGNITYVNDAFLNISGHTKEELIGKNHNIVRHLDTPSELHKEMWETIQQGNVWSGIVKNKTKSDEPYWVDTTVVPVKNGNNEIVEYMAIRHDLTELFTLNKEIEATQKEIIYKMGEIGETRSKETGNHVKRVAQYSRELALLYALNEDEAENLFTASPMHDIGKVAISDDILKKPGKLTNEEFETMKEHTTVGFSVLKGSTREVLKAAAIVANEHHEKWNGRGYPQGLKGEEIHIYGRITAIADVFDALGSDRCYKKAWDDERIFKLFEEEKAEHFDPKLVDLFLENRSIFIDIREKYKD